MSPLAEIKAAIEKLPRRELWELKAHVDRRCEAEWDAQIEEDARAGGPRDKLVQEAWAAFQAGRCQPLP